MAKKSAIARNIKRIELCERLSEKREGLKAIIMDRNVPMAVRLAAIAKRNEMPRDSSYSRIRRRCANTGRPRGNYRQFGICRHELRKMAHWGLLPGVHKVSL